MLDATVSLINNNKIVMGITMLIVNMGSRYVISDLSPAHERLLSHVVFKKVVVFCMFFVTTRDVILSVCLTAAFLFLFNVLLHENSKYCILPWSLKTGQHVGGTGIASGPRFDARQRWNDHMREKKQKRNSDQQEREKHENRQEGEGYADEGFVQPEFVPEQSVMDSEDLLLRAYAVNEHQYQQRSSLDDKKTYEEVTAANQRQHTEEDTLYATGNDDGGIEAAEEGGGSHQLDPSDPVPYSSINSDMDMDNNDITRSSTLSFVQFDAAAPEDDST